MHGLGKTIESEKQNVEGSNTGDRSRRVQVERSWPGRRRVPALTLKATMGRLFTAADDKRLIKSSSTESDELFLVLTMFHEGPYNPDEASTRTTSAASTAQ